MVLTLVIEGEGERMKVLFVFSGNSRQGISPFIKEQASNLIDIGVRVDFFPIKGKGFVGYIRNIRQLKKTAKSGGYHIVHGHFLWSIIISLFSGIPKKIGTFHGSDLNIKSFRFLAKHVIVPFLDEVIVVNNDMRQWLRSDKVHVIPCGVDTKTFYPYGSRTATTECPVVVPGCVNIVFSSSFDRFVKNYPLAKQSIDELRLDKRVNLIELRSYSREQVAQILNAVDLLLLTSLWEGSPQVVKEAMACNTPIVSVDVGDVRWLLDGLDGCYVASHDPEDIASKIKQALDFRDRTKGRKRLIKLGLDSESIAKSIIGLYHSVLV